MKSNKHFSPSNKYSPRITKWGLSNSVKIKYIDKETECPWSLRASEAIKRGKSIERQQTESKLFQLNNKIEHLKITIQKEINEAKKQ